MSDSSTLPAPLASRSLPPLILACLAATWLIWGSTYLAIKWALVSFPPFYQMGTRFLVAGALMAAWLKWRRTPWPDRREWANATLLGALMLGVGYGLTAVAEMSVSSGLVVAFIAIGPALQAAMEWPYGVRPTRLEAAGIGLGLIGVVGLAAGQGFSASPGGLLAVL
ncbi:MAG: EamA family transporter, partial [Rubrivivax sp.]|nr:EamA family transporter [Rubrivivax sp.]